MTIPGVCEAEHLGVDLGVEKMCHDGLYERYLGYTLGGDRIQRNKHGGALERI
jgi:hypothetical protein